MKLNQYSTGTAQPGLSVNKILPIEIIYPSSLEEQTQIVQEIESRLSVTDNLEFVIRDSIEKAEALRQSILKKAFEGKLLSVAEIEQCKKEADYEPAGELLKKIANEKLQTANGKLRITNEKLQMTNGELRITNGKLRMTNK
jgi:type I restriction enzyme S subunit